MTPEEFERIKEEEKAHLRKLKALKEAARTLGRQQRVTQVLERMVEVSKDVLHKSEDLVDRLTHETARQEARLDIAMESADERNAARDAEEQLERAEEELAEARAKATLREMKQQLGVPEASRPPAASPMEKTIGTGPKAVPPVEKTIGPGAKTEATTPPASSTPVARTSPADASDADQPRTDEPLPEKTIGRMRR